MSSWSQRAVDGSSFASHRSLARSSRFHIRRWHPSSRRSSREFVAITHRTPASPDPKGRASIFGWRPANHRGAGNPTPPPPQPIPPLLPRPRRCIRRIHRVPHPPSCALCAGDAGRRGRGAKILLLGAEGTISGFIGNSWLRCASASAKVLTVEVAAGSGGVPTAIRAACPAGGGGAIWSTYQIVKNI